MILQWYRNTYVGEDVEAVQLTHENAAEVTAWCNGQKVDEIDPFDSSKVYAGINIPSTTGMIRASEGDYVIRDVEGFFYMAKPGIFQELFQMT